MDYIYLILFCSKLVQTLLLNHRSFFSITDRSSLPRSRCQNPAPRSSFFSPSLPLSRSLAIKPFHHPSSSRSSPKIVPCRRRRCRCRRRNRRPSSSLPRITRRCLTRLRNRQVPPSSSP